jgi:hypothetical protein
MTNPPTTAPAMVAAFSARTALWCVAPTAALDWGRVPLTEVVVGMGLEDKGNVGDELPDKRLC